LQQQQPQQFRWRAGNPLLQSSNGNPRNQGRDGEMGMGGREREAEESRPRGKFQEKPVGVKMTCACAAFGN
jgi:hypothetical protein